ncbi:hypothetical protein ACWFMI_23930 [Nocardiopsis terrae]|uniref:hypothetical protein n=1 Tax=Streptomyces sp. NPDC057554 TaxID=3350538 RepID=UPI0036BC1F41
MNPARLSQRVVVGQYRAAQADPDQYLALVARAARAYGYSVAGVDPVKPDRSGALTGDIHLVFPAEETYLLRWTDNPWGHRWTVLDSRGQHQARIYPADQYEARPEPGAVLYGIEPHLPELASEEPPMSKKPAPRPCPLPNCEEPIAVLVYNHKDMRLPGASAGFRFFACASHEDAMWSSIWDDIKVTPTMPGVITERLDEAR